MREAKVTPDLDELIMLFYPLRKKETLEGGFIREL